MRWAALAVIAIALCGCETTAETSARLEREAKRHAASGASGTGLSITHTSTKLKVVQTAMLRGRARAAAAVTLRNSSAEALRAIPIAVTVKDASGSALYTNSAPGLTPSLVSVPYVPAHGEVTWVDDQVTGAARARGVSARVGEGARAGGRLPALGIREAHLAEDPANGPSEEGTLANESHTAQQELVIYAVARQGQKIVAAGRAVLPEAAAASATPFQIFFVGDPRGAQIQLTALPSTLARP